MASSKPYPKVLYLNIDDYINPWLPHIPISRLPTPITRFLGVRQKPQADVPNVLVWVWAFIGAFAGITTVSAINKYAPVLQKYNPPVIIGSLGASAVLDYNAISTPLAQPRNALFGQALSAIIGVAITKLFQLSSNYADIQWLAGATCCASASFVMGLTNTVHPPGGATAVLAATNAQIMAMGWMYIPFVLLGSVVMLAIALLLNNIQRRYPIYWWTAAELPARVRYEEKRKAAKAENNEEGGEKTLHALRTAGSQESTSTGQTLPVVAAPVESENEEVAEHGEIAITKDKVMLPRFLIQDLGEEEARVIRKLQIRLRTGVPSGEAELTEHLLGHVESEGGG